MNLKLNFRRTSDAAQVRRNPESMGGGHFFLSYFTLNGQIEHSMLRGRGVDIDAEPSEWWEHGEHSDTLTGPAES